MNDAVQAVAPLLVVVAVVVGTVEVGSNLSMVVGIVHTLRRMVVVVIVVVDKLLVGHMQNIHFDHKMVFVLVGLLSFVCFKF